MDYVEAIESFFDYIIRYVQSLIDFLTAGELDDLLVYLYQCIPEPVRIVIFVIVLLFMLVGFVKAFRK